MKRILSMFALALMASVAFGPLQAVAQKSDSSVDASIDDILNAKPTPSPVAAAVVAPIAQAKAVQAKAAEPVRALEAVVAAPVVPVVEEAQPQPVEAVPVEVPAVPVVVVAAPEQVAPAPVVEAPAEEKPEEPVLGKVVLNDNNLNNAVEEESGVLVSMAFEESPLPDVIRAFRDATGANIISHWTNATPQLVSMRLDNVPWHQGLSSILSTYGLQLKEEPRGSKVYIVTEMSTIIPRYTQTFELKHAKADLIEQLLKSTLDASSMTVAFPSANAVVVKATEEQLKECEAIIKVLDKPSQQVYIEARFVRLSSSASKKLGMKWDSLSDWGVTLDKMSAGYERNSGTIARYNTGDTEVRETSELLGVVDGLNYSKATYDKESGLTSYEPTYKKDDYEISRVATTIAAAPGAGRTAESMAWKKASGYGGQLSVDQFRLALSAFENMDGVQMFSNPKIIVENETKAKIDMTTKYPNVSIDYQAATQTGQRDSISSKLAVIPGKSESWVGEAFFSYGIALEVTPRISPTGLITVEIIPSISSLSDTLVVGVEGSANSYPIIKIQRLDTTFTMADGKTAVIGGLTETVEGNTDSGIPLLRKIPWIGPHLFGWKSRDKQQYEIIVFVTVGIIDGNTIQQDAGMPKNAVLSRGLFNGSIKEPGDRTDEEMFNLESTPERSYKVK